MLRGTLRNEGSFRGTSPERARSVAEQLALLSRLLLDPLRALVRREDH
jgi:hypothetical protein